MENKIIIDKLPSQNIKKSFGGAAFLIAAILLVLITIIDIMVGFFCNIIFTDSMLVSGACWFVLVVLRYVPCVLLCIALFMIHIKAIKNEISTNGFKIIKYFSLVNIISNVLLLVITLYIMFDQSAIGILGTIDELNYVWTTILSVAFVICSYGLKIILGIYILHVSSCFANPYKKLTKTLPTAILLIVFGSLILVNFIWVISFINSIIKNFGFEAISIFDNFAFIFKNYFNLLIEGIIYILLGIAVLRYCLLQKKNSSFDK